MPGVGNPFSGKRSLDTEGIEERVSKKVRGETDLMDGEINSKRDSDEKVNVSVQRKPHKKKKKLKRVDQSDLTVADDGVEPVSMKEKKKKLKDESRDFSHLEVDNLHNTNDVAQKCPGDLTNVEEEHTRVKQKKKKKPKDTVRDESHAELPLSSNLIGGQPVETKHKKKKKSKHRHGEDGETSCDANAHGKVKKKRSKERGEGSTISSSEPYAEVSGFVVDALSDIFEHQKKKNKKKKLKEKKRVDQSDISITDCVVELEHKEKRKKKKKLKDKSRDVSHLQYDDVSNFNKECLGEVTSLDDEIALVEHYKKKKQLKEKQKVNQTEITDTECVVEPEHKKEKHKKKKKLKDKIRDVSHLHYDDVSNFNKECLGEVMSSDDDEIALVKHKKKKKSMDTVRDESQAEWTLSGNLVDSQPVKTKHKKKKKTKDRHGVLDEISSDACEDDKANKKKSKLDRSFDHIGSLLASGIQEQVPRILDSSNPPVDDISTLGTDQDISELLANNSVSKVLDNTEGLIHKIDSNNRALSSTPNKGRNRKLANKSDLNLLINPPEENYIYSSSYNLDNSITGSLDVSLAMQEGILPELHGGSMSVPYEDLTLQTDSPAPDQTNTENISAASVSWHVPVTSVAQRTTPRKFFLRNLARDAVSQVLAANNDGTEQGVDPLDEKYSQPVIREGSSVQRRSLLNYEQLCKTVLEDPGAALQQGSSTGDKVEEGGREKRRKTSSTVQQRATQREQNNNTDKENRLPGTPRPVKKDVTIGDLYRAPSRKKVPLVLFQACCYIFDQKVPVNELNRVYTGHCVPREREYRRLLRRKYGAKFSRKKYAHYEDCEVLDLKLLRRFNMLIEQGVVQDKVEFCNFLKTYCNGRDQKIKSKRSIGVRNIVGLFVGQDSPYKIAAVHCFRLINLVLGGHQAQTTETTPPGEQTAPPGEQTATPGEQTAPPGEQSTPLGEQTQEYYEENIPAQTQDDKPAKGRSFRKWTLDEDQTLIDWVIGRDGDILVENVDTMEVDWDGIALEVERPASSVREHWGRVIQPALVEDPDPYAILDYRKRLLEEVREMGVVHRKEVDWQSLAEIFHPRSSASIRYVFNTLVKNERRDTPIESCEDFQQRVADALAKVERLQELPETEVVKSFKGSSYKSTLRTYYLQLIGQATASASSDTDSDSDN